MIDPGRLNTRLVLQSPVEIDDGQGGVSRGYADIATIWARVAAVAAPPRVEADAARAVTRLRIVARAPLALSLDHRLIDGAKIYRVTGYRDDRRFVEIDAEQAW